MKLSQDIAVNPFLTPEERRKELRRLWRMNMTPEQKARKRAKDKRYRDRKKLRHGPVTASAAIHADVARAQVAVAVTAADMAAHVAAERQAKARPVQIAYRAAAIALKRVTDRLIHLQARRDAARREIIAKRDREIAALILRAEKSLAVTTAEAERERLYAECATLDAEFKQVAGRYAPGDVVTWLRGGDEASAYVVTGLDVDVDTLRMFPGSSGNGVVKYHVRRLTLRGHPSFLYRYKETVKEADLTPAPEKHPVVIRYRRLEVKCRFEHKPAPWKNR